MGIVGAGFVGPVLATTLVAWAPPAVLYLLLAAIALGCIPLVGRRGGGAVVAHA